MVTAKFPLLKAAHLSGEAEDIAKKHVSNGQEKNAICVLDVPLNWENEFPQVQKLKHELVQNLNSEVLPRGFLHKIQTLYNMSVEQKKHKQNESWQWIMAYDFARIKERKKNDTSLKNFLDTLQKHILTNNVKNTNYTYLELLNVAARWAELETKNEKN